MAKKKSEPAAESSPEPAAAASAESPPEPTTNGRHTPGVLIGQWKRDAFAAGGTNETIAQAIMALAEDAGYTYTCTPEMVAAWKAKEAGGKPTTGKRRGRPPGKKNAQTTAAAPSKPAAASASAAPQEGSAITAMRQLIQLIGRSAVKNIVDSL